MSEKAKSKFRIRNWKQYNQALVNRGSITVWFAEEAIENWHSCVKSGKRGRPQTYSDAAIRAALIIKTVFKVPFRALEGLLTSLMALMELPIQCPDYTVLCRRAQSLGIHIPPTWKTGEPLHLVFDSTGLKIFGEGEWKVRKHGYTKRRTWRKVHIGLCAKTQQVVIAGVTTADVSDGEAMLYLMDALSEETLEAVYGDGAYDDEYCRGAIYDRGARQVIPPQKNAKLQGWDKIPELNERDEAVKRIRALGADGRAAWKREVGYHRRSLVETAMYRSKQIFGERLTSRKFRAQATEVAIRYQALNRMTLLGMPDSYRVGVTT